MICYFYLNLKLALLRNKIKMIISKRSKYKNIRATFDLQLTIKMN